MPSDEALGLDFKTAIWPDEVGLDCNLVHRSSPSGNRYLSAVLKDFMITESDTIIDIGCGKGSAMRTMLAFPFSQIAGVELSDQIANIAINNFRILGTKRCVVYIDNAASFSHYRLFNFFYLYNPFPCHVMTIVLERMNQSLEGIEKTTMMIYNNPECHELIIRQGWSKIKEYPAAWDNKMFVYVKGVRQ